jgi:hypothetical protein
LNCLRLIRTFLSRFDKEHIVAELKKFNEGLSQKDQTNTRIIGIKTDVNDVRYEIEVNSNCVFWELVRKSATIYGVKINEL